MVDYCESGVRSALRPFRVASTPIFLMADGCFGCMSDNLRNTSFQPVSYCFLPTPTSIWLSKCPMRHPISLAHTS